ncbi:MAG: alpha/beta hydrolase [Myxococcota bacterium]
MIWWFVGCAVGTPELLVLPDADRAGEAGELGPFGAAWLELAAPARVTEVVPVDVVFPTEDDFDTEIGVAVTGAPVVVMIHGGLVPPERYRWLGEHWATRGYVTLLPRAELDLAISQPGNGAVALDALRRVSRGGGRFAGIVDDDGPVAVGGHSLGGVMAARQWTRDDDLDLLLMMASFPANGDAIEEQAGRAVIGVSGTTDQSLTPDDFVDRNLERFGEPPLWLVEGLNHYGWTDDPTEGELAGDGPLQGELDALRSTALTLLDRALDVHLRQAEIDRDAPVAGATRVQP